jgi:hypothetical protein
MLDTIEELAAQWDSLCEELPQLGVISGNSLLRDLVLGFRTGVPRWQTNSQLSNLLLSPLVIIAHLAQYTEYLGGLQSKGDRDIDVYALPQPKTETLGFCLGILSAMVVSCSTNRAQFIQHGATAIRLAIIIGAIVDAQDIRDPRGPSGSLATAWKPDQLPIDRERILQNFPEVSAIS